MCQYRINTVFNLFRLNASKSIYNGILNCLVNSLDFGKYMVLLFHTINWFQYTIHVIMHI